ncbi:zinc-dependent alcohol dehydrogenase family protein [Microbacterium rhizophilus]|uniref:zinc-dependent alcohol dehydrogenase family protein n=1 Tax=Microbacterium rhizophilus TaxID=3138934 RepID=UPI0031EA7E90
MRATTIHGPGDIRFETVPDPEILHPTDAIVRVTAGCVCGSDLWHYRGLSSGQKFPRTIGHECLGEVVETGSDVTRFAVGDRVVVPFNHSCGHCAPCFAGVTSACENRSLTVSGQAELARVGQADGSLVRYETDAPDRIPSLLALSDVMATGWHASVSAGVTTGSTAVVVGDGAVGLCGVIAAHQLGAERIVAMSRHPERQTLAREFGATDIVAERGAEGETAVRELMGGAGADAVLECVGTNESLATAYAVARPGATVGFVGVPHGVSSFPMFAAFAKNVGLRGGSAPVRRYLPDLLALVEDGEIDPGRVFDLTLPLADAAEGYRAMDERRAVKVLLTL